MQKKQNTVSESLHQQTRDIWDLNAPSWDEKMGDEGNDFHRILMDPTCERLLNLQADQLVLEIGCGNGVFARRLARSGAHVLATDYSQKFLDLAQARNEAYTGRIEYRHIDATSEEELLALGEHRFDAIVSQQAIMDMTTIEPMLRSIPKLLKPDGCFIFTVMHPCFNSTGASMMALEEYQQDDFALVYSIKVSEYLDISPKTGGGIAGQPKPHYYFHRPLHELLGIAFRAGLVMDGIEEPAFNYPEDGSTPGRSSLSWANYKQIPPVLIVRMRI